MPSEPTKYHLIPNNNNNIQNNNHNLVTQFKDHFSIFKTKKSTIFVYGVVFIFIAITIFLAFSPSSSSNSTSSWFVNIFTVNNTSPPFRSPLSSDFSSKSTQFPLLNTSRSQNTSNTQLVSNKGGIFELNNSFSKIPENPTNQISTNLPQISPKNSPNQDENFELTNTYNNNNNNNNISPLSSNQVQKVGYEKSSSVLPKMPSKNPQSSENITVESVYSNGQEGKMVKKNNNNNNDDEVSDFTASLSKKSDNYNGNLGEDKKQGKSFVSSLIGCDLYDGEWVKDESYPLYKAGSCDLIDEQFNCKNNGRPDDDYQKLKWKPKGCNLPRLKGRRMLKLLKGKRLVFVGDSLNRNMWESLVCILKNSVKNPKNVYEAYGRRYFRNEVSYSFVFKDYNCTIEFFVAPFLVRPFEVKDINGTTKETLRLDLMVEESEHFKNSDILIFNTGHWWTHEKTSKGEDYYQEGSNVYKQLDVTEAFRKAITTWGRWVDANINPKRTHVFFRGYSNSHFSGGQWNSGGACDSETEPIKNEKYLTEYPLKMQVLDKVLNGIKTPISYLNITRMTDYRKDAHPSIYRKQNISDEERKSPLRFQDCSHWCLPGVPDLWNELLYAEMLRKKYQDKQQV